MSWQPSEHDLQVAGSAITQLSQLELSFPPAVLQALSETQFPATKVKLSAQVWQVETAVGSQLAQLEIAFSPVLQLPHSCPQSVYPARQLKHSFLLAHVSHSSGQAAHAPLRGQKPAAQVLHVAESVQFAQFSRQFLHTFCHGWLQQNFPLLQMLLVSHSCYAILWQVFQSKMWFSAHLVHSFSLSHFSQLNEQFVQTPSSLKQPSSHIVHFKSVPHSVHDFPHCSHFSSFSTQA
ncbi:hypothetical protein SS50377_28615 [Spironucleus salmonicida]|uniref:Uncharacterized protein n=1 Tax=Spironucleus salmonicida TaxID=348837 RepID=V6LAT4_9EUKA|nr:hypothetical protein SS50377_28615 [Spironucleus salmonicida]|eukprot:EST41565.1 Hypothetical protein SS50377_ja066 [Spironucleus salmonicida]